MNHLWFPSLEIYIFGLLLVKSKAIPTPLAPRFPSLVNLNTLVYPPTALTNLRVQFNLYYPLMCVVLELHGLLFLIGLSPPS